MESGGQKEELSQGTTGHQLREELSAEDPREESSIGKNHQLQAPKRKRCAWHLPQDTD